ncbi:hypothetical protein PsYK624_092260 [Phanerochaete sordida]|uniref:Hyaluronan/mRNA-binding protein domain-containing protein n=1 Tax=Phanerochaete sordida TaxID=48140 RepID=A0A9P3GC67_9APHY|nr:hypothetical protein PsYK624_092260 [Phanerochaete sordida]
MTRTERSTSPRAILKDRSVPRNAMGHELKKDGAGPHNWGSLRLEQELEEGADFDERDEDEDGAAPPPEPKAKDAPPRRQSVTLTEEEKRQAADVRKNALKSPDVDLAAIARSSHAVSHTTDDKNSP